MLFLHNCSFPAMHNTIMVYIDNEPMNYDVVKKLKTILLVNWVQFLCIIKILAYFALPDFLSHL